MRKSLFAPLALTIAIAAVLLPATATGGKTGAEANEYVVLYAEGASLASARLVAERWPGLDEVKSALRGAGALAAVMSGSGSSVVGIAPSRAAGVRIREGLAERPWRTWLTRTVSGPVLGPAAARASWGVAKR